MLSQWNLVVAVGLGALACVSLLESFTLTSFDPSTFVFSQQENYFGSGASDHGSLVLKNRTVISVHGSSQLASSEYFPHPNCGGKERLLSILRAAETERENACSVLGYTTRPSFRVRTKQESPISTSFQRSTPFGPMKNCDYEELCDILPSWHNISQLYGHKPVILGLDTCQQYRELLLPNRNRGVPIKPMIRVAGLYNSGTNALASMFYLNFNNNNSNTVPVSDHDAFLVPWGKHVPAKYRLRNTYPANNTESKDHVLPVVVVRDPYRWMNSMCKERYSVILDQRTNCPYLFGTSPYNGNNRTYWVVDRMDQGKVQLGISEIYESVAHMWVEWHKQYLDADFPRLIIRFEDLLFHTEKVMQKIADCAGISMPRRLSYRLSSSKNHGNPANFVSAISKYGTSSGRYGRMTRQSFEFSRTVLHQELMEALHYPYGLFGPSFT